MQKCLKSLHHLVDFLHVAAVHGLQVPLLQVLPLPGEFGPLHLAPAHDQEAGRYVAVVGQPDVEQIRLVRRDVGRYLGQVGLALAGRPDRNPRSREPITTPIANHR